MARKFHISKQLNQGYNREKDESKVRPAVLFHGNIKTHINKAANEKERINRGKVVTIQKV